LSFGPDETSISELNVRAVSTMNDSAAMVSALSV
jgi:hypothetical protein